MKTGITQRLFLAILAATGVAVVSMVIVMQWNLDRGFLRYINAMEKRSLASMTAKLEALYAAEGSFDGLKTDPRRWDQLIDRSIAPEGLGTPPQSPSESRQLHQEGRRRLPPRMARAFASRLYLLDQNKQPLILPPDETVAGELTPLHGRGEVVGYLGLSPQRKVSEEHQLRFLKQQKDALILVGGILLLVAGVASLFLAKRLVKPIMGLARATHQLTAGNYDTRVPVLADDEIGQLARDFNILALTLEKNEQSRRQWVADISHELRTPLAVLRGEIEAMQDGIRKADGAGLNSLHGEVLRLGRLVDDLYQLSLADLGALTYRKEAVDLTALLQDAVMAISPAFAGKGIAIGAQTPKAPVTIFADRQRLRQLLDNLLGNSLKYTDPGGQCQIALSREDGAAIVEVQDSAPGVAGPDLDRLFERLYRVEGSRSRAAGGAGLGLAICQTIVEAHAGMIECHPSPLGGLSLRIILPLEEK